MRRTNINIQVECMPRKTSIDLLKQKLLNTMVKNTIWCNPSLLHVPSLKRPLKLIICSWTASSMRILNSRITRNLSRWMISWWILVKSVSITSWVVTSTRARSQITVLGRAKITGVNLAILCLTGVKTWAHTCSCSRIVVLTSSNARLLTRMFVFVRSLLIGPSSCRITWIIITCPCSAMTWLGGSSSFYLALTEIIFSGSSSKTSSFVC